MSTFAAVLRANLPMATIDSIEIGSSVKGLIFDYGGTLDSRGDHWAQVIRDAYLAAGVDVGLDDFIKAYVHAERALAANPLICLADTFRELMRKKIAVEMQWLAEHCEGFELVGESRQCGAVTLSECGKGNEIADWCYEHARKCVGESAAVLHRLRERYPMVLVSNFYGNLRAVIEDFGISDCFKAVVESATVGVRKPDPAIFRLGLDALGLSASEVLVVGDSLDKDILPARALGCQTALLTGRPWPPTN